MEKILIGLKVVTASVLTGICYMFGGWDAAMKCLITAMIIDYLTGIAKAVYLQKLDSGVGLKGIVKKLALLLLVALGVVVDKITGNSGLVRLFIIYYIVANEGLSICENLGAMDIIIPQFLKDKLKQLQEPKESDVK